MFGLSASITALVVVLGLLIGLGAWRRGVLGAGVLAFYPAALIYEHLPFFAPTTNLASIATFVGLFALSFWGIRGHTAGFYEGGFARAVALALAGTVQVIALWVFVLPELSGFLALSPVIAGYAEAAGYGTLLLAPIALFVARLV